MIQPDDEQRLIQFAKDCAARYGREFRALADSSEAKDLLLKVIGERIRLPRGRKPVEMWNRVEVLRRRGLTWKEIGAAVHPDWNVKDRKFRREWIVSASGACRARWSVRKRRTSC